MLIPGLRRRSTCQLVAEYAVEPLPTASERALAAGAAPEGVGVIRLMGDARHLALGLGIRGMRVAG